MHVAGETWVRASRLQLCPACLTRRSGDDDRAEPVEEMNSILTAYGRSLNYSTATSSERNHGSLEIGQREARASEDGVMIPEGIVHALRNDFGRAPGTGVRGWSLSYNNDVAHTSIAHIAIRQTQVERCGIGKKNVRK